MKLGIVAHNLSDTAWEGCLNRSWISSYAQTDKNILLINNSTDLMPESFDDLERIHPPQSLLKVAPLLLSLEQMRLGSLHFLDPLPQDKKSLHLNLFILSWAKTKKLPCSVSLHSIPERWGFGYKLMMAQMDAVFVAWPAMKTHLQKNFRPQAEIYVTAPPLEMDEDASVAAADEIVINEAGLPIAEPRYVVVPGLMKNRQTVIDVLTRWRSQLLDENLHVVFCQGLSNLSHVDRKRLRQSDLFTQLREHITVCEYQSPRRDQEWARRAHTIDLRHLDENDISRFVFTQLGTLWNKPISGFLEQTHTPSSLDAFGNSIKRWYSNH